PPVASEVERVDDVVERRTQVEEAIPGRERDLHGIETWDLADVEAVFESVSVSLRGDGIRTLVTGVCESFLLQPRVVPLLPRPEQRHRHALTSAHGEQDAKRATRTDRGSGEGADEAGAHADG